MRRLALVVLAACWTGDPPAPQPPPPPRAPTGPTVVDLTPKGLEGIWLTMTLEDFRRARPKATPVNVGEITVRREYFEDFTYEKTRPPNINVASFYFGPTTPYPLYEIHVAYEDTAHANFALDDRYVMRGMVTPPQATGDEDEELSLLVTIKAMKFEVGAWVYGRRLVVAAGLPFTERSDATFGEPLR